MRADVLREDGAKRVWMFDAPYRDPVNQRTIKHVLFDATHGLKITITYVQGPPRTIHYTTRPDPDTTVAILLNKE